MKRSYWIIGIIALLIIAQFFQPDRTVPETPQSEDLLSVHPGEGQAVDLIKTTCYDCHSNQTKYPWYSYITPVNFWLQSHINEGREHINFSTFSKLPREEKMEELEESAEAVSEGWMPLNSYTYVHADARFSKEEQKAVSDWFLKASKSYTSSGISPGEENHDDDEHEEPHQ